MTRPAGGPDSCHYCLAWGLHQLRMCRDCIAWRLWQAGTCAGCGRHAPAKHRHCRLCHAQAALQLNRQRFRGSVPQISFTGWQLFLSFPLGKRKARGRPRKPAAEPQLPPTWQLPGQLALFPARPDYRSVNRARHVNPDNPALIQARAAAQELGQARGWSNLLAEEVDEALLILLSGHAPGDLIPYSDIVPLDKRGANVGHTAEVLSTLGLLHDDRTAALDAWIDRFLLDLAPAIATDVLAWATMLRRGGPRSRPRNPETVRHYLKEAEPWLITWSTRYTSLRQVTQDDIRAVTDTLNGLPRKRTMVALRSLFGFCKATHRVFIDPANRITIGNPAVRLPAPLHPGQLQQLITHTAGRPHRQLILALAAVHAARPMAIRAIALDDVDVPNRRITIAGHPRRLDDLTAALIDKYLIYRRDRWPHTANRHLLLTSQTAHDQRPVSTGWLGDQFEGAGATINQIRIDRQLEEALSYGPDPLHLVAVFGISENTAIRYAEAARQFLHNALETGHGDDGRHP
ncbi:site-specific integrase [Thermoactinospora rubra]|uniref:site-specific integrase n=1 Tax=Thermoactinospora rubra TaxID=1088767 RepID=UPI000A101E0E|nr:site-specific integrase [Thermoactinospora rubra]